MLRKTCITEGQIKGNAIVFDVVGSGSATAVTRGVNGLIPSRADDQTQNTCTLTEWHDLVRKTNFNVFASQGDQRAAMQRTSMGVINRKIDDQIITELATATQDISSSAVTMGLNRVMHALAILGNNNVPIDSNLYGLLTPAAWAYLMQVKEFSSAEYVNNKTMPDAPVQFRWAGVNWMVHSGLPSVGTSSAKCFVYHRNAIGHGMNVAGLQSPVGYDEEQDYSWARCSAYMGAKLLQNAGVVVIPHDDSGFAAV